MRKTRLLTSAALSAMLAFSASANAANNFDDIPEEEIAQAVVNVLKKDPKIAYDAVLTFRNDAEAQKAKENAEMTPLEQKIAEVLKNNPPIVVGALQVYEQQQKQKELRDLAVEYGKHINEINRAELFVGNPNAKYTLVEFFDFSCGYCKQMAPRLKNLVDKNPDVKVIFKPMSFLSPNSELAAKAAVAANNQGKFIEMYSALMKEVRLNEAGIEKIAKDLGLDMDKYRKDFSSSETQNLLSNIKKTADTIKIRSVPTLILNGMPLYAVEETQLQRAIDVLRQSGN